MLQVLKRAFLTFYKESVFSTSVEDQKNFLSSFPNPTDDIERSYFQYRCQARLMPRGFPLFLNCAAIPLLFFFSFRLRKAIASLDTQCPQSAIFMYAGSPAILPLSLSNKYAVQQVQNFQNRGCLSSNDLRYLRQLRKRYPFAFYFRLKCMLKIAMYSEVLLQFRPAAIICSSEYSFTSSLLTDYCHLMGVKHINVMHGEKLYDLHDAFFHFDCCYVWDQHYVDLFRDLFAEPSQFLIETPPCLKLSLRETSFAKVDYTYYLANEDRATIERIFFNLSPLLKNGAKIALRLHPLHLDHTEYLINNPYGFEVELPNEVPLEESFLRTGCVISLFSTVLFQAISNDIPIVIDDITSPRKYGLLSSLRYIVLDMPHRLLSQEIHSSPKSQKSAL